MKLYLVRHGEAAPAVIDKSRSLTLPGREGVDRVGRFLKEAGVTVPVIRHSGKARAEQTAEILAEHLDPPGGIEQVPGLGPMDPVSPVVDEVNHCRDNLMLVGHLPFMEILTSALLTGRETHEPVAFSPATVVCLERTTPGLWSALFLVSPRVLG